MKKWMRCVLVSRRSRRNIQPTWSNSRIFKTSMRRKRRNFLTRSDTRKRKSKSSTLSSLSSLIRISYKRSLTTQNGMKKRGSGRSLTSPTGKKWSISPNFMAWQKKWSSRRRSARKLFSGTLVEIRSLRNAQPRDIRWTALSRMPEMERWFLSPQANTSRTEQSKPLSFRLLNPKTTSERRLSWYFSKIVEGRGLKGSSQFQCLPTIVANTSDCFL